MLVTIIDIAFGVALFINAFLFIPQIIRLVRYKDSQGLSFLTFFGFCLIQLITILHGFFHGDPLLMWGYVLSFITCSSVAILIVRYRYNISN